MQMEGVKTTEFDRLSWHWERISADADPPAPPSKELRAAEAAWGAVGAWSSPWLGSASCASPAHQANTCGSAGKQRLWRNQLPAKTKHRACSAAGALMTQQILQALDPEVGIPSLVLQAAQGARCLGCARQRLIASSFGIAWPAAGGAFWQDSAFRSRHAMGQAPVVRRAGRDTSVESPRDTCRPPWLANWHILQKRHPRHQIEVKHPFIFHGCGGYIGSAASTVPAPLCQMP
eukprot:CAMPEP_0181421694 /NCGR_PEP_ID=MMETSP1110-20121109/13229_1 /TAXON_ID=174948 /ORGANISM="Symbiodinium sp., Strain CCMP421" /LENGTH=232 /DNA_ID=CAMNT_0023544765 /DNA_START=247 /DNA_END=942 /DNA_ORIENTATION=+